MKKSEALTALMAWHTAILEQIEDFDPKKSFQDIAKDYMRERRMLREPDLDAVSEWFNWDIIAKDIKNLTSIEETVDVTFGEIFGRVSDSLKFDEVGVNEWALNEGMATKETIQTLTKEQALVFMSEDEFERRKS